MAKYTQQTSKQSRVQKEKTGGNTVVMHELVRNGRVIFKSTRKLDTVFAHQKYTRAQGVDYRQSVVAVS